MLLWKDQSFSQQFKTKLHDRIEKQFTIRLPGKAEEDRDDLPSRQLARDAVGLVRKYVKRGLHVYQFNTYYGAARNIIGGSCLSLLFCLTGFIIFARVSPSTTALILLAVFALKDVLLLALSRFIMTKLGETYARQLFTEYMDKE